MRYLGLICDYDGTIAHDGRVAPDVLDALARVRASGRKLVLLTGRELPDLLALLPSLTLFDRIVAENGALLYNPETKEERLLTSPPPPIFFQTLRERGVKPLSRGRIIVATEHPQETVVIDVIRQLGLEVTVTFNKGSVMMLPSGVNKASGLKAVLKDLNLEPHQVVGVGDAENDHAFLEACGYAVAVANALPMLKEEADWVTAGRNGSGVQELVKRLLTNDLADGPAAKIPPPSKRPRS